MEGIFNEGRTQHYQDEYALLGDDHSPYKSLFYDFLCLSEVLGFQSDQTAAEIDRVTLCRRGSPGRSG